MTDAVGVRRPYRVAYVIGELGKGGAEYQLYELVRGLDRTRFDPAVFVLAVGRLLGATPARARGARWRRFPGAASPTSDDCAGCAWPCGVARPTCCTRCCGRGTAYGRLAAVGLGIPVVVTAERNVIARPPWQVAIERVLDRWTDVYLVNSRAIVDRAWSRASSLPAAKMRVVHNGIDLTRLPPFVLDRQRCAPLALGFDPRRRLVAQVGRLEPAEGLPDVPRRRRPRRRAGARRGFPRRRRGGAAGRARGDCRPRSGSTAACASSGCGTTCPALLGGRRRPRADVAATRGCRTW